MSVASIMFLFATGALVAYLTSQASGSGAISLRADRLRRDESRSAFQIVLVFRALVGVLYVVCGVWGIFDAEPHR